jgi:hypothetical protein
MLVWINVNGFLKSTMHSEIGLLVAHYTQSVDIYWEWLSCVTDALLFNARHDHLVVWVMIAKQGVDFAAIN